MPDDASEPTAADFRHVLDTAGVEHEMIQAQPQAQQDIDQLCINTIRRGVGAPQGIAAEIRLYPGGHRGGSQRAASPREVNDADRDRV
jgi:hypothetical protein